MLDPAEQETERRRIAGPVSFDRMIEATFAQVTTNVELAKAVRLTLMVVAACAVISMALCTFLTFSMYGTMGEMRAMLQTILDTLARAHP